MSHPRFAENIQLLEKGSKMNNFYSRICKEKNITNWRSDPRFDENVQNDIKWYGSFQYFKNSLQATHI